MAATLSSKAHKVLSAAALTCDFGSLLANSLIRVKVCVSKSLFTFSIDGSASILIFQKGSFNASKSNFSVSEFFVRFAIVIAEALALYLEEL